MKKLNMIAYPRIL